MCLQYIFSEGWRLKPDHVEFVLFYCCKFLLFRDFIDQMEKFKKTTKFIV